MKKRLRRPSSPILKCKDKAFLVSFYDLSQKIFIQVKIGICWLQYLGSVLMREAKERGNKLKNNMKIREKGATPETLEDETGLKLLLKTRLDPKN